MPPASKRSQSEPRRVTSAAIQAAIDLLEAHQYIALSVAPLSADEVDYLAAKEANEQHERMLQDSEAILGQPGFASAAHAADLRRALQTTAREVSLEHDAAMKRTYLPKDWAWMKAHDAHPFLQARRERCDAVREHIQQVWASRLMSLVRPAEDAEDGDSM